MIQPVEVFDPQEQTNTSCELLPDDLNLMFVIRQMLSPSSELIMTPLFSESGLFIFTQERSGDLYDRLGWADLRSVDPFDALA